MYNISSNPYDKTINFNLNTFFKSNEKNLSKMTQILFVFNEIVTTKKENHTPFIKQKYKEIISSKLIKNVENTINSLYILFYEKYYYSDYRSLLDKFIDFNYSYDIIVSMIIGYFKYILEKPVNVLNGEQLYNYIATIDTYNYKEEVFRRLCLNLFAETINEYNNNTQKYNTTQYYIQILNFNQAFDNIFDYDKNIYNFCRDNARAILILFLIYSEGTLYGIDGIGNVILRLGRDMFFAIDHPNLYDGKNVIRLVNYLKEENVEFWDSEGASALKTYYDNYLTSEREDFIWNITTASRYYDIAWNNFIVLASHLLLDEFDTNRNNYFLLYKNPYLFHYMIVKLLLERNIHEKLHSKQLLNIVMDTYNYDNRYLETMYYYVYDFDKANPVYKIYKTDVNRNKVHIGVETFKKELLNTIIPTVKNNISKITNSLNTVYSQ